MVTAAGRSVGRLRVRGLGGSVVATVPRDVVNLGAARRLATLGTARVDDGYTLSTTALAVLDGGSVGRARGRVLASRAVGHVVVELQTSIKLDRDGEGVNGEVLVASAGRDARSGVLVARALARDGSAGSTKGTSAQEGVTLAEVVLARPALEVESSIVSNNTGGNVAEVPAVVLLGVAVVVGVAGAAVGLGVGPRATKGVGGSNLLNAGGSQESKGGSLHDEVGSKRW